MKNSIESECVNVWLQMNFNSFIESIRLILFTGHSIWFWNRFDYYRCVLAIGSNFSRRAQSQIGHKVSTAVANPENVFIFNRRKNWNKQCAIKSGIPAIRLLNQNCFLNACINKRKNAHIWRCDEQIGNTKNRQQ